MEQSREWRRRKPGDYIHTRSNNIRKRRAGVSNADGGNRERFDSWHERDIGRQNMCVKFTNTQKCEMMSLNSRQCQYVLYFTNSSFTIRGSNSLLLQSRVQLANITDYKIFLRASHLILV